MKKIFTLLMLGCLFMTPAFAQDDEDLDETFEFVDANGKVVPNGSELTCSTLNDLGQISTGLSVRNTNNSKEAVQVAVNISKIANGQISVCFPKNCLNFSTTGEAQAQAGTMEAEELKDFETEWVPTKGSYGEADATFQLVHKGITSSPWGSATVSNETEGYGPKITVHFVYADPTAINAVNAAKQQSVAARYNLLGQRVNSSKGLQIVKFADGKTMKVMK